MMLRDSNPSMFIFYFNNKHMCKRSFSFTLFTSVILLPFCSSAFVSPPHLYLLASPPNPSLIILLSLPSLHFEETPKSSFPILSRRHWLACIL
ncbi:hypothetical protein ES332_A07G215600v1 [Gossypium tomentosum]|uniref:Uncharacterized protein n=1 Tax=Gossypium tomentosum TaxID=34277 RepID=A0A5D2PVV3_GOSTO|nr:hypothetical protein ES332_A07G215600v1 [Gossypium tomentosum]